MFRVYNCLAVDHDLRLVLLAAVVCLLASAVAVSLFHRAQATAGRKRLIWLSLNATAAGCGIWATHFIAMLAYTPAVGAGYNLALTALSLLIAILITGSGLGFALLDFGRWVSVVGGAVAGGGIAAMHYTGMAALELPDHITWAPGLLVTSIVFGVVFAALAVAVAARRDDWTSTIGAVLLFTLAVVLMHFTAMGAIQVLPDPRYTIGAASLSPNTFSIVIAASTTIILGMCLVAALSDRKWEGTLRRQKRLLDTALANMSQGLCMFDADGRILLFNRRYATLVGLPPDKLEGASLLDVIMHRKASGEIPGDPEAFAAGVIADVRAGKSNNRTVETAGGRALRVIEQPRPEGGWVSTLEDITAWRDAQERISHMAHHDSLTDLANRTQLVKKLEQDLGALRSNGGNLAAHFIDLDRFKSVNDALGHDGGDILLKVVAERLRAVVRHGDMVARLGGDEFVIVQAGVTTRQQAEDFASRIALAVTAPLQVGQHTLLPTVSIGVALAPFDGDSPERLLKSADLALYKAKGDGRNCIRVFHPEMDAELEARTELERAVRDAVLHDRFVLHYQPLFEISGRALIGFEALLRMPASDGTLIPPMKFIPVAEELQLIDRIGAWVLREACRTAATWPDDLTVAVNLSPSQFTSGTLAGIVAGALAESGLAGSRLELEITEALLLKETSTVFAQLRALKEMGVRIVMDDFGTGYSSLSYLWRFPFDKIKIDRSFMRDFDCSGRDAMTVVKTIIALGRELNMRVTVEGVETAEQAVFLEDAGSDQVQGFYFGKPIPAADVGACVLRHMSRKKGGAPQNKSLSLVEAAAER